MSLIVLERRDAIAIIRLNRPEKRNALSRAMLEDLSDAFNQLEKQPDLRAVILTGSGEAFCSGADINELEGLDKIGVRAASERGQAVHNQIANCPAPVIAAINGIAAGGGCELALACHLRVASSNAQFTLPEIKLGVIPGYVGTQRRPHEVGYGRSLEVMLTGKTISAEQGYQLGFVNQVTDPANVFTAAESMANDIAKLAPLAIRACLEAVTCGLELSLQEALTVEAQLFASLFGTDDMREGTSAFLEKRTAVFKGT